VVTARAAHLLDSGVDPSKLLVITFTNKACGELKERLVKLLGVEVAGKVSILTFHGLAYRILL
jgi:DNA helicase-2/ATP-dependent DNA helicase PcrA